MWGVGGLGFGAKVWALSFGVSGSRALGVKGSVLGSALAWRWRGWGYCQLGGGGGGGGAFSCPLLEVLRSRV